MSSLAATLTTLLTALLTTGPAIAGVASSEGPFEGPEATVWISNPQPQVEEPFFLEVELRWSGGADRLLPHPPRLVLPESWEAGALAASTRTEKGRSVVLYRIELTASEPGVFHPDPLQVRWTPRDHTSRNGAQPQSRPIELPEVTVTAGPAALGSPASPPAAAGSPGSTPPAGAMLVVLLLATGALLLRRIRSRLWAFSTEGRDPRSEHDRARRKELLRQAERLRQDGHSTEAVRVLGQILHELDIESPLTASRLEEMRYGGNPPRAEELEGLEGRVRCELDARAPREPMNVVV